VICGDMMSYGIGGEHLSTCQKPAGHRSEHHGPGCWWTDRDHWGGPERDIELPLEPSGGSVTLSFHTQPSDTED